MADAVSNAPTRSRARRWIVRCVILAAFLLIAAIAAESVRRSDLPRRIVVDALADATGLAVKAASVRVSWGGSTVVEDLEVTVPLDSRPLLKAKRVIVEHAALIRIVVTGDPGLASIDLDGLTVSARKDELDRWNLLTALDRIAATAGTGEPSSGFQPLPDVAIRDGVLELDSGGTLETTTFSAEGRTINGRTWTLDADVKDVGTLNVHADPSAGWEHRVDFRLAPRPALLRVFAPDAPDPVRAAGTWRGTVTETGLSGRVTLTHAVAGMHTASGNAGVNLSAGAVRIEPRDLVLVPADQPSIRMFGGAINAQGTDVRADSLGIATGTIAAGVNGHFDAARGRGHLDLSWIGAAEGKIDRHAGRAALTFIQKPAGRMAIEGSVETSGAAGQSRWSAYGLCEAEGDSLEQLTGKISFTQLILSDASTTLDFSKLRADIARDGSRIRIESVTAPDAAESAATGWFDLTTNAFEIDAAISKWRTVFNPDQPVDIELVASGDGRRIDVSRARIALGDAGATAVAHYDPDAEFPVAGTVSLVAAAPTPNAEGSRLAGRVLADLQFTAALAPLSAAFTGTLSGEGLAVAGRQIGALTVPCTGRIDGGSLSLRSDPFELLDGRCTITHAELNPLSGSPRIEADLSGVDLTLLSELLGLPEPLSGRADATLSLVVPARELAEAIVEGRWRIMQPAAGKVTADSASGTLETIDSRLILTDLQISRSEGRITGGADLDLRTPSLIRLSLRGENWPVTAGLARLAVDGSVDALLDSTAMTLNGEAHVTAGLALEDGSLADLESTVRLDGRTVILEPLKARIAGGELDASATIAVDDWTTSVLSGEWSGIDLAALVNRFTPVEGLTGGISGSIRIAPDKSPAAGGPLALTAVIEGEGAAYRGVPLARAELEMHYSTARTTLDRLQVDAADGRVIMRGTTTMHGEERFVQIRTLLESLDVAPITAAIDSESQPVLGRLSGEALFAGYTGSPHRLFGEAQLSLANAELFHAPVFGVIYDGLRLGKAGKADGVGRAHIRLSGESVEITRLQYFKSGADILLAAKLHDVTAGADSEVSGLAVGLVRPLKDIGLPFLDQFDRILAAVQTDAVNVRIGGTLREIDARVAPFSEVGDSVTRMIGAVGP